MGLPPRVARSLPSGDTRVVDGVESWWRHAGCEPAEEREWIHVHRDRPIGVGFFQGDPYEAVGLLLHSLLRNRRAQDVAQQCLAALGIEPARAGGRVQREPIE